MRGGFEAVQPSSPLSSDGHCHPSKHSWNRDWAAELTWNPPLLFRVKKEVSPSHHSGEPELQCPKPLPRGLPLNACWRPPGSPLWCNALRGWPGKVMLAGLSSASSWRWGLQSSNCRRCLVYSIHLIVGVSAPDAADRAGPLLRRDH